MDKNTQRFVDLINTKLTELVGEKISYCCENAKHPIYDALGEWYNECIDSSFDKERIGRLFYITITPQRNHIAIGYKGELVATIDFKKTKGDTHKGFLYWTTDYYYKSFEFKWSYADQGFTEETETIEQRLQCIDAYVESVNNRKEQELEKALRIVKAIKKELGEGATLSDAMEMVYYINNHRYDIKHRFNYKLVFHQGNYTSVDRVVDDYDRALELKEELTRDMMPGEKNFYYTIEEE